jgi:hypothetical protein
LLAELIGPLDRLARDRSRAHAALALDDEQLLNAVAGRRAAELSRRASRSTPAAWRRPGRSRQSAATTPATRRSSEVRLGRERSS